LKTLIAAALIFGMQVGPVSQTNHNEYVHRLEQALFYDLKPLAGAFVAAEEEYGVSAVLLSSIAALESGWGRSCFAENNIFGFGAKSFPSKEACIDYVASFIRTHYLTPGGKYFHGYEIEDIGICWNPCNAQWGPTVRAISEQIQERMDAVSTTSIPQPAVCMSTALADFIYTI